MSVLITDCSPGAGKRLRRRAGSIDANPVEPDQVVFLLDAHDRRIGIRRIAAATAYAGGAGRDVSLEEEAVEGDAERSSGLSLPRFLHFRETNDMTQWPAATARPACRR